jgi:hypothetical protein
MEIPTTCPALPDKREAAMAKRDDILNDLTHQRIPDLSQRIFYTLTADKTVDTQRIARMLGFLIRRLNDREILSDKDVIEMLFGSVSLQRGARSMAKRGATPDRRKQFGPVRSR